METKNPVIWFEIYVNDLQRARTFYEKVLNIQMSELPSPNNMELSMIAFPSDMQKPGASGALVKMEGFKAGGNSTLIYFASKDCSIEESRIEAAGGKVFKSKESLDQYGFMVLAYDTEGNMFGVHSLA